MMYTELYQYLLKHKELPVPGIGTFLLQKRSAVLDFPNRKINPPTYAIIMERGSHLPGKNFFTWLAGALGIVDREAIFRFNDFAIEMKKQITDGDVIHWEEVGILSKGLSGDVKFVPAPDAATLEKPVSAEKVIREKAAHMVRVGEDEKSSEEMTEMLSQPEERKNYWWAYALAIALVAFIFIGWHFSEYGMEISSVANGKKVIPAAAAETYRVLP
ncbi:MAG: hypothetical protein ABL876_06840 [Chitinophagaceae bacterium]